MFSEKKRKITFGPSATVKTGLLVLLASIGFMLTVTVTATAHAAAGSAVELPVPEDVRAVVIDGKTAFYASEPEIRAVLDGIIDDYTDDSTVSACFRESEQTYYLPLIYRQIKIIKRDKTSVFFSQPCAF